MAITAALHSSNVRFADLVLVGQTSTTLDLSVTLIPGEIFSLGTIILDGLFDGTNYTVTIDILNSSGAEVTHCTMEICDPAGQGNDVDDPVPQPSWVPAGFSTSNDDDGLSYAQGSGIPRTSSHFSTVIADELNDDRDFLDFSVGGVDPAETFDLSFGLRHNPGSDEQPFLLVFRANLFAEDDPGPTIPVDGSVPCCTHPHGTTPGDILPEDPFRPLPAWIQNCLGGGVVPQAADPVDAESWA